MNVRRAFVLGSRHFALLCKTLAVVVTMRLALLVTKHRHIAQHITVKPAPSGYVREASTLAWAVRNTARIVPFAHCLTQALSLQYLLGQQGMTSTIRVGVQMARNGTLDSHAWLIHDGTVLLGGSENELAAFTKMVDLTPS
ncbi:lasso peptide biosynthesis B2 protein [Aurantiacibacter xanthus]|uniref:Lasso peptide biosynthesis B2 protein n=1 Tax=Aurantiacibacter xanthus TaxID=1784712 RepID=A0A3A1P7L6_9SPHN|nr:lasso peptide biosynthesis B2 protein [Aurantiacibacter xanthus]RIV89756.1 lasso peptide biosynthesis B2 protein [Aurantiacibacter xanthus]